MKSRWTGITRILGPIFQVALVLAVLGGTSYVTSKAMASGHKTTGGDVTLAAAAAAAVVRPKANIKALRATRSEKKKSGLAIVNRVDAEKRDFTPEEKVQLDALKAEVDSLETDIDLVSTFLENERRQPATVEAPEASKSPWASMSEMLRAVRSVAIGKTADPRLFAALGQNETVDAEGGFLITPQYSEELIKRTYDVGLIAKRCFEMPMESNTLVLRAVDEDSRADGSRWGGIQAFWNAEAQSFTGSKAKFREMRLTANKLIGLVYVTDEQLEDGSALQAYIDDAFPDEFAFKIDQGIFSGTGAGQPLGFTTSNAVIVQAEDGGQSAATITTSNILNMWSRMFARSRQNAAWFIDQSIEPQLYPLTLGAPSLGQILLYTPPGANGNASGYGMMMGKPVIPIEYGSVLGTQGDITLADMNQYILGRKGGMKADTSIHVAFLTGEQAFRFTLRIDGQPMWKKPLTPKSGGPTVSPFVTLATRS